MKRPKKNKMLFKSAIVLLLVQSFAIPAMAETSDWFYGRDLAAMKKVVGKNLLTKIECRDTVKKGVNWTDFEYRVTYVKNPGKIRFRWAVGNRFGPNRERAERDGYKLVSYKYFIRPTSKLKYHCAVWHKKP